MYSNVPCPFFPCWPHGSTAWLWINVQCSPDGDDSNLCGDKGRQPPNCPSGNPPEDDKEPNLEAYSEPLERYSKTTFCTGFFNMDSLSDAMKGVKSGPKDPNNLRNYQNRARVMFHEMTHMNYFMNAPKKSPIIDDVQIDFRGTTGTGRRTDVKNAPCYGPELVKILANYEAVNRGGHFPQRNADSYT